jgi:LysR family transcriptional activator of nhaA
MFNYNHLYYFYVTAREGGVNRAADVLKISQPSLSSQLKALERETSKSLFVKVGRRLELTTEGQVAYAFCKQMFEISSELSRTMKMEPSADRSRLQVAVGDEIERPFAAAYLSLLMKAVDTGSRSVRMVSNRHNLLLDDLSKNRFDFLISNYSVDERDFTTLSQMRIPVYAVCSSKGLQDHNLPKSLFSGADLASELNRLRPPIVIPTMDQKLRQEIDYFLEQSGVSLPVVFESNVLAAVTRSTIEGLGISFLPITYVERELRLKQLRRIGTKPLWYHGLNLICKAGAENEPLLQQAKGSFDKLIEA